MIYAVVIYYLLIIFINPRDYFRIRTKLDYLIYLIPFYGIINFILMKLKIRLKDFNRLKWRR